MMKFTLIVFCALAAGACAAPGQSTVNTPQSNSPNYPPSIEDSAARQQAAEEAWAKFFAEFRLPAAKVDLEPVTGTPRAMPMELAGRIYLNSRGVAFDEMEAKEALRRFLEKARGVLGGDALLSLKDLSLLSFTDDGSFYRAVYQQSSYPFPIANGYGELRLSVGKNGTLLQWSSRLIPKVDLPARAEVAPQSLREKFVGREFSYANIAGQPMRYKVAQASEISIKELVVYPKVEGKKMSIHLAYPVEVGKGMTWTVYVDAITGAELGVKQNFAS
jgi:hypothetical protein